MGVFSTHPPTKERIEATTRPATCAVTTVRCQAWASPAACTASTSVSRTTAAPPTLTEPLAAPAIAKVVRYWLAVALSVVLTLVAGPLYA